MDQDRVEGSAKTIMGRVKSFVGGLIGDSKLKAEGKADQVRGPGPEYGGWDQRHSP
jgi:uncharacterized protein YjbJ (UPF0337 family)